MVTQSATPSAQVNWPIRLFNKSLLKREKYQEVTGMLGDFTNLHCLDIGADNGVISYLLRQEGGTWKSADLDAHTVEAIRSLVGTDVYQIDDTHPSPFADNEFDAIVIIDFLEHIHNDDAFVQEMKRIIKPGGTIIANVPHARKSLLKQFQHLIGQTDEKHGHVRPGYTAESLQKLFGDDFSIQKSHTYSRFFAQFIDTMIVFGVGLLKRGKDDPSQKGNVVTGQDMNNYAKMFKLYSLIYPIVWFFSKLDLLIPFTSGFMLIARATANKSTDHDNTGE